MNTDNLKNIDMSLTDKNQNGDKIDPVPEKRKKIGLLDTDPKRIGYTSDKLTPVQRDLREALVKRFAVNKINKFITEQISHINYKHHLADGLRMLFDEHGRLPANAPLEDIIAARQKIESEIRMLEAICTAMRNHLTTIKEIEDLAFEMIEENERKI